MRLRGLVLHSLLAATLSAGFFCEATHATVFTSDLGIGLSLAPVIGNSGGHAVFLGAEDRSPGILDVTFDDQSPNPPDGSAPYPSDMQSVAPLSFHQGESLAGIWSLGIMDDFMPNEGDDLVAWSIFGTTDLGTFDIPGPPAFNVDTNPATFVDLVTDAPGIIRDVNLRVTIVPEPSTLALLTIGALALTIGWWRRRRGR